LILEDDENISLNDLEKIQDLFITDFSKFKKCYRDIFASIDTPFDYISAEHKVVIVLLN
jgi:hypothetical protein